MALDSLTTSFLGGIQASAAVLLTISYGIIATQYNILSESSAKDLSRLCVKIFLPALLLSNVGSQLNPENIYRYIPVLGMYDPTVICTPAPAVDAEADRDAAYTGDHPVWSLTYTLISIALGWVGTRFFNFPSWTAPAVAFNNTVSLPLVLVQSLDSTGILSRLVVGPDDTTSKAILRAKSYFLVCSLVSSSLIFGVGPKLLDLDGDEAPEPKHPRGKSGDDDDDAERGTRHAVNYERGGRGQQQHDDDDEEGEPDEHTPLLPDVVNRNIDRVADVSNRNAQRIWDRLPGRVRSVLEFIYQFLVAPLIGAVIGAIIGLAPPLRRVFFNGTDHGGIFGPWLTSSVKNVGDLFAALQLIVVGCKLSSSLRAMKEHKDSGEFHWIATAYVFAIRFIFWPLVSIPIIWALATKTNLLGDDPMLWFCLMMISSGPPAIKTAALAEIHNASAHDKMSIAKLLVVSLNGITQEADVTA
ncbi:MAG: hypothetical protein M1823_003589 [Watsoniomyces obsoletus]|nr:MAG: hypothetical protein M1823_003589 [Watsoniomyces obsoletus]